MPSRRPVSLAIQDEPVSGDDGAPVRRIPRPDHCVSRSNISQGALRVLYRLKEAGFQAYIVGGGVRDLLLGRAPKDFDVATDARPEQVRELFRNCRLIGRRFRLAHVHFGDEIVEVATFRARHDGDAIGGQMENGRIVRDNVFGTIEDDAWRRDFTINALYYSIEDFSIVDYVGGMADLQAKELRLIGDPWLRYREDPVRMLRAVRFASKLGFRFAEDTEAPLPELAGLLREVPPARLFDEILKLFMAGFGRRAFHILRHFGLFAPLFPQTDRCLEQGDAFALALVDTALAATDARVAEGKSVTPAYLYAAMLWAPLRREVERVKDAEGVGEYLAIQAVVKNLVGMQSEAAALPKRFALPMQDIWAMQPRFRQRSKQRVARLMAHPRFRAGYDFLCLRAQAGDEEADEACQWWTERQEGVASGEPSTAEPKRKPRRRSKRRRGKSKAETSGHAADSGGAEGESAPGADRA